MSWMAPKLDRRIQIQKAVNDPVSTGSFERTYTTLKRIWANIRVDHKAAYVAAIRGVNSDEEVNTHLIKVRRVAVERLGVHFSKAFDSSFDSIADINAVKSNYFVFIEETNQTIGRRLMINGTQLDEVNREYININATEIEERGTGE